MEELPKRKRKPPKRYHGSDQDEEVPKVTSNPVVKPRRRKSVRDFTDPDLVEEAEGGHIDVEEPEEEERMGSTSKSQAKAPKNVGKLKGDGPPSRKKARKVLVSDPEEDDCMEAEVVPEEDDFDEDNDHESSEDGKRRGAKGKGKLLAGRRKKRKVRGGPISSPPHALESSDLHSKKVKPSRKFDESLVEGEVASTADFSAKTSPAALKPDSPVPQLKKIKLPAIKKNKPQGTTEVSTPTPTSATPATKPRLPLDIISAGGSKQSEIRKAQIGASDLDLSNKSIYQELFKTSLDGGAPRTGLNRRAKEEERRKDLNKMKEEYLAKRAREEHSFDLQARPEKIARFEDKLRYIRSAALFPNALAAKWKEVYEKEKKRQKGQHEWNEDGSVTGREEGEVK